MKNAILLHLYYQDLWPEFKSKLEPILSDTIHLYVSVVHESSDWIDDIKNTAKEVFVVENRGTDAAPFIKVYSKVRQHGYKTYTKLHGKKSLHTPNLGDGWRRSLYYPLLDHYNHLVSELSTKVSPWMAGTESLLHTPEREGRDSPNRRAAEVHVQKMCAILGVPDHGCFFAGTMWMTNAVYLEKLFKDIDLDKLYSVFEEGYSQNCLAHGFERVSGYGVTYYDGFYYNL
jgi:lipopolysaccharide biosynthesis protein